MSSKRKASPHASDTTIFSSTTIDDRRSTFIAHYSPTTPARTLQALPVLRDASHRIAAWRLPSRQTTLPGQRAQLFDVGHDDDGEQWAGKRLERVLEEAGVTGSVVVGRWYGGVLLGPVRFKHIEDCAKEAIERWRKGVPADGAAKKQRVEEGQRAGEGGREMMDPMALKRTKDELLGELKARDESVSVLRELLRQKKMKLESGKGLAAGGSLSSPPAAAMDYSILPLVRLRALEKARDATISFLLRQIDKAEEDAALEQALDDDTIDDAWDLFDAAATVLEEEKVDKTKPKGKEKQTTIEGYTHIGPAPIERLEEDILDESA
jgi:hypothetical protein